MTAHGPIALGHSRLSILDTSPAGNQPMQSADGRYTIVHNGEIYNFLELADDLRVLGHEFHTRTDTEVILAGYREWGPACVERFNGIWAFALWDSVAEQLFLSRDRFGIKPLYLTEQGDYLAFSSEIKALLTLPDFRRDVDLQVARDYLVFGQTDHTNRSFFTGINKLPAATNRLISPAASREWRYWQPSALATDSSLGVQPSDSDMEEEVRAALIDAVQLQLRSDVSLGTCLSGGLDSSAIVTVANGIRRKLLGASGARHMERDRYPHEAFFADFTDPGIAERPFVDAVVAMTGMELHTTSPEAREFVSSLTDVVRHQDEPFGSASIVAQYHVMKLAGSVGIKVLLDGQGADEIFGGYPAYMGARYSPELRSLAGPGLFLDSIIGHGPMSFDRLIWAAISGGRGRPWQDREARRLAGPELSHVDRLRPSIPDLPGTPLARRLWREIASETLPSLLRFEDRNSMAFGIEARVPFLDHRLVEKVLMLPDRLKISGNVRKVALRNIVKDIVPGAVLDRRDKIGFAAPERRWIAGSLGELAPLALAPSSERRGLVREGAVQWALGRSAHSAEDGRTAWRILSLELWLRISVESRGIER